MITEKQERDDGPKEYSQIVVPSGTAYLYKPDGWEVVYGGWDFTTLRKRIKTIKEGDN